MWNFSGVYWLKRILKNGAYFSAPIFLIAGLSLASGAANSSSEKIKTQNLEISADYIDPFTQELVKAEKKKAPGHFTVVIGIPSKKISNSKLHIYRAGYERAFADKLCKDAGSLKCIVKELDKDPRIEAMRNSYLASALPSGLDMMIWGSDFRINEAAAKTIIGMRANIMFHNGSAGEMKYKFMRPSEPWPIELKVAVNAANKDKMARICEIIKAKCSVHQSESFDEVSNLIDYGQVDFAMYDGGWSFKSKDLEDRLIYEVEINNTTGLSYE